MLALDDLFPAFDGVSFFAYTDVRVVGTGGSCSIDRYFVQDAVLVDG